MLAREANTFANGVTATRLVYGNSIVLNEKNDRLILRDAGAAMMAVPTAQCW